MSLESLKEQCLKNQLTIINVNFSPTLSLKMQLIYSIQKTTFSAPKNTLTHKTKYFTVEFVIKKTDIHQE